MPINPPGNAAASDIGRLHLPHTRHAIPYLHAYLRARILDGTLTPDTRLSQVQLAKQLGVSRTPLREVLRMLQQEGLVDIEPNQRTRIAGLDPRELDEIYASRILLETLALSLTMSHFESSDRKLAKKQLSDMRAAARRQDIEAWIGVHAHYHRTITLGAGESLQKQLRIYADRTIRYIRIYQIGAPRSWQSAGDGEHADILAALIAGDEGEATSLLAHHLARTALQVLKDCAPSFIARAVPCALELVDAGSVDADSQLLTSYAGHQATLHRLGDHSESGIRLPTKPG